MVHSITVLRFVVVSVVLSAMFGLVWLLSSPDPRYFACDAGQYYDPAHAICQGFPPVNPRPGYGNPPSNVPQPPIGGMPGGGQYPGGNWR